MHTSRPRGVQSQFLIASALFAWSSGIPDAHTRLGAAYFMQGMQCLMGQVPAGTVGVDPTGAPLLPLLYIVVNLSFNISALYILRLAGWVHRPTAFRLQQY